MRAGSWLALEARAERETNDLHALILEVRDHMKLANAKLAGEDIYFGHSPLRNRRIRREALPDYYRLPAFPA